MTAGNGWGGARKGAGRKPQGDKALKQATVYLSDEQLALFRRLGGSAWLRKVLDAEQRKTE